MMEDPVEKPSWRKPAGALAILALVALWVMLVATQAYWIGTLPVIVQTFIYVIAGIAWIFPAMPILRWMETGRFR